MCKSTDDGSFQALGQVEQRNLEIALRERGLDLTAQRRAVFEAICNCSGHICAEHILNTVTRRYHGFKMNKTTVYRALDLLLELGLISEHKCGDGSAQYEPASRGPHSHLLCRSCGSLFDIDSAFSANLRADIRNLHGFLAELENYPIFGLCAACSQR
jgi:Fur family ferric uptake transcriptional regulator